MPFVTKTYTILCAFAAGLRQGNRTSRREAVRKDKALRAQLSEEQIDKMLRDSFPASDPIALY